MNHDQHFARLQDIVREQLLLLVLSVDRETDRRSRKKKAIPTGLDMIASEDSGCAALIIRLGGVVGSFDFAPCRLCRLWWRRLASTSSASGLFARSDAGGTPALPSADLKK